MLRWWGFQGRIIRKRQVDEVRRQAMAEKMGFDAYAVTSDMPDPTAQAITAMLDHLHAVEFRIETMCQALREKGVDCGEAGLPKLKDEDFESVSVKQRKAPAAEDA